MSDRIFMPPEFGFSSGANNKPVILGVDKQTNTRSDGILDLAFSSIPSLSYLKDIILSSEARWLGNYMIGIQGMGKSNLLKQIALTDIANHEGVCVISPHPDLTQDILMRIPEDRWDDVVVFDPSDDCPIGLNIFEWEGPKSGIPIDKIADDVVTKTFQLIWADSWGPRMEEMMANVARTILYTQSLPPEKRPTLAEFELIVGRGDDTGYRDALMEYIQDTYKSRGIELLKRYWNWFDNQDSRFREQIASSTLNKARPFAANELIAHVVGQSINKVDFREIMDESKILLVDLNVDKLGTGNVELMGSLLVGRLFLAALSRETYPPPPRFHIIADEFGYFATPAFAALQDQARKFGVDVLVAHQRRGQLDNDTRDATRSARNWVVFNVNPEDARELSEAFDSTPPPTEEPGLPMESQSFVHASNPWNHLKQQGHENQDITELMHWINSQIESKDSMDLTDWTMDEFYKKILSYTGDSSGFYTYLRCFNNDENRIEFVRNLNIVLYKIMTGQDLNNCQQLVYKFCDGTFLSKSAPHIGGPSWERSRSELISLLNEDGGHQHLTLIPDGGKNLIEKIVKFSKIFNKYHTDVDFRKLEKLMSTDEYFHIYQNSGTSMLAVLFTEVHFRRDFAEKIMTLGKLLIQYPVWVRGGQPTIEIKKTHPRPHTDITLEWKNRFAHLPQYEAWCRVQEGREINEYHIQTIEIDSPPASGFERAEQVREISRRKYGTPRDEIEELMATRIDIEADKAETVEKL